MSAIESVAPIENVHVEEPEADVSAAEVGEMFRHWRRAAGVSQVEFAALMNLSDRAYVAIENGEGGAKVLAEWIARLGRIGREVKFRRARS